MEEGPERCDVSKKKKRGGGGGELSEGIQVSSRNRKRQDNALSLGASRDVWGPAGTLF